MRHWAQWAAWHLALGAVLLLCARAEAAPQKLQKVQSTQRNGGTRITLTLDSETRFIWGELHKPERLYFDLVDTAPLSPKQATIASKGTVSRIRVALTRAATTRVVLDLTGPADFDTTWLKNPQRLVIDVRRRGSAPSKAPAEVTQAEPAQPAPAAKAEPPKSDTKLAAQTNPKRTLRPFVMPPRPALPPTPLIAAPRITIGPATRAALLASIQTPLLWTLPTPAPPAKQPKATVARNTPARKAPKTSAKAASAQPASPAKPELIARVESKNELPDVLLREDLPAEKLSKDDFPVGAPAAQANTLTRALGLKLRKVVLDAGHGGKDVGTISPHGLYEKDLVLDVTLRLGKLIEEQLGSEVVYTRQDDTFIPLGARPALANKEKADLFLSIHANSSRATDVSGFETYYLNFSQAKPDMEVASRENAAAENTIADLNDLVQQIMVNDKLDESRDFAGYVQKSTHALSVKNGNTRDRGVKRAPFLVLIGAHIPSVLVEIGFLSNPAEETRLKKPAYRQKIAEALFEGISGYAASLSHFTTAQAARPATNATGE